MKKLIFVAFIVGSGLGFWSSTWISSRAKSQTERRSSAPLQNPIESSDIVFPEQKATITETTAIPLSKVEVPLRGEIDITSGAGAIQAIGDQLVIMDRFGQFFIYEKGRASSASIPALPMEIDAYRRKSRFPLNESTLRAHDLKYSATHRALFATFERYDAASDTTSFVLARISYPVRKLDSWSLLYSSAPLKSEGYYSGRGAGGKIQVSGESVFIALGDYNLDQGDFIAAQDERSDLGKVSVFDLRTRTLTHLCLGLRVPQGLVLSRNGSLLVTEHSARGGDRLIEVQDGANYGWPYTSLGTHYLTGKLVKDQSHADIQFAKPLFAWVPSIAPTAIIELSNFHERWNGDLLVGSLKAQSLFRIHRDGDRVLYVESIWIGRRIRDMVQRGNRIFILTDDASLLVLSPEQELVEAGRVNRGPPYKSFLFLSCVNCHSFTKSSDLPWGPN